ncbi:hypothetical protein CNR22_07325 [Sphingobacteriaceae bacterium]|nr:hypothetical protein CNR22_07325 [Sphingobacteriaceae bacterium]
MVLSAAISLLLYYKNKKNSEASTTVLKGMAALRFLSFFFILLFLLNIFFKHLQNETENPIVLLAIDNSSSIRSSADSAFVQGDFLNQLEKVRSKLGEKHTLKTVLFGSKAQTSDEKATFSEKETDLENLVNEVENNYSNQNIGALIVVSDGIYNKGSNPVYSAEKLGYPIYTVAMGDTNEIKDVLIQKVNHNQVAYAGNNFPVEVVVNAKKFAGKEVIVSLLEGGTEKSKQTLKIASDNFLSTCNFTLSASKVGVVRYTAKVSILDGEKNTANNSQPFVVEVIDNKEKILLLAVIPHPDVAAIKEAISDGTNYEVDYALTQDFTKPVKPYSLVIIHGYSAAQAQLIADCKNNLVPFWIINPAGPENLPGLKISGSLNRYNDSEPYIENSFGLFTISDDLKKFAKDLPAVKTFFGNYSIGNGSNNLINQRIGQIETENPILFFTESSGLKSAVFLGDGLWKWKFRDFAEHKNFNLFTELISKSVQYLSVKSDKSFFRVSAPKIINENTEIELGAEVYNKSYESVTDPDVTLVLTNSEDKKFNYTFSKTTSAYKLNIGVLPPGEYRYEASVKNNKELFVKQGVFAVKEVISEKINTVANHQLLYQLANRSNGKLFYPNELQKLEDDLLKSDKIKAITYSQISTSSLIDLKWLFWLILGLLSAEWFFRKRFLSI